MLHNVTSSCANMIAAESGRMPGSFTCKLISDSAHAASGLKTDVLVFFLPLPPFAGHTRWSVMAAAGLFFYL